MDSTAQELLDALLLADDISSLHRAAEALARGKFVNAVRKEPRFEEALRRLFHSYDSGHDFLLGVSLAYRLGSASKPVMARVRSYGRSHFRERFPPLNLLSNAKDRYYVALALADATGDWTDEYIANSMVEDSSAELARSELAHQLLSRRSLSDTLRLLADAFRETDFDTLKRAESAARRMRRICESMRPAVVAGGVDAGTNVGEAIRAFFEGPSRVGAFESGQKAWVQLANEACALVGDILRTQIRLLADPAMYMSLQPAAEWVDKRMWPRFVHRTASARGVQSFLVDAIALLAKQGVTDQKLLTTLEFFTGSRDSAAEITAGLADATDGLDEQIATWLRRLGRVDGQVTLQSLKGVDQSDADEYAASLLLQTSAWDSDTAPDADSIRRVTLDIQRLGRERRLSIRLKPGEIVDYVPSSHELLGGHRLGVRRVRVEQPLVERRELNGRTLVIQKAIVVAAEEDTQ